MFNEAIVQGKVVQNPVLRYTKSNQPVTTLRIGWTRKHGEILAQLYIDCVIFGERAQFACQSFTAGMEVLVSGELQSKDYVDREGVKRTTFQIFVDEVNFCGTNKCNRPEPVPSPVPGDGPAVPGAGPALQPASDAQQYVDRLKPAETSSKGSGQVSSGPRRLVGPYYLSNC